MTRAFLGCLLAVAGLACGDVQDVSLGRHDQPLGGIGGTGGTPMVEPLVPDAGRPDAAIEDEDEEDGEEEEREGEDEGENEGENLGEENDD